MRPSDVQLTPLQVSGNDDGSGYIIGQRPYYEYVDGKKTGNQIGITYDAVFPDNSFEKTAVKVEGTQAVLTDEQIKKSGGKIKARFINLTGRFYRANSGEYMLTCRANGIEVIS